MKLSGNVWGNRSEIHPPAEHKTKFKAMKIYIAPKSLKEQMHLEVDHMLTPIEIDESVLDTLINREKNRPTPGSDRFRK